METVFDTLRAARELEASGFERPQAEALAGVIRSGQGDLVTKADLAELKAEIKGDIAAARADMVKWMFGAVFVLSAWLFALLRILPATGT